MEGHPCGLRECGSTSSQHQEVAPENRPPEPPPSPKRPAAEFMGRFVEVELTDGRLISGVIACTDREPNFILNAAEERWERTDRPRNIGMAMIARRHVKRILMMPIPNESEVI